MTEHTFILRVRSADMLTDAIRSMVLDLADDLVRDHCQTEILSLEVAQDYDEFRPLLPPYRD